MPDAETVHGRRVSRAGDPARPGHAPAFAVGLVWLVWLAWLACLVCLASAACGGAPARPPMLPPEYEEPAVPTPAPAPAPSPLPVRPVPPS